MKKPNVRIGIRPVIDGRWGGIREGLEEQTMGMAMAAKELIETNLRHSDGSPVECVIADSTIGGGEEAAACAENLKIIMYALLSPLPPAGVTVLKLWIWIRLLSKQYGDLTVQSVPAPCTLPL